MRIRRIGAALQDAVGLSVLVLVAVVLPVRGQNPGDLMPEASSAKGKAILQLAIDAMGGEIYLNAHASDCTGRRAQFEHSGALGGFVQFHTYWMAPDKTRIEYGNKGNIVELYAGKQAWSLDRGGVSEETAEVVADYQEQLQADSNTILRYRMNDPELIFRYDGHEVVDLKMADWVEIGDRSGHTIRIAVDQKSHLPLRSTIRNRDAETGSPVERTTLFSNYHSIDGVQIPFQIVRLRNGMQVYQSFYESCQYNTNLSAEMFTRASLEQRFREVGKKK